jgi:hypothetical protein
MLDFWTKPAKNATRRWLLILDSTASVPALIPFILLNDYAHAMKYISLDESFGTFMRMRIALRTGNKQAVLAESDAALRLGFRKVDDQQAFLRACVNHAPDVEFGRAAAKFETDPVAEHDPELLYQNAEVLGFCGQADAALRQLRKAVDGGACSYGSGLICPIQIQPLPAPILPWTKTRYSIPFGSARSFSNCGKLQCNAKNASRPLANSTPRPKESSRFWRCPDDRAIQLWAQGWM